MLSAFTLSRDVLLEALCLGLFVFALAVLILETRRRLKERQRLLDEAAAAMRSQVKTLQEFSDYLVRVQGDFKKSMRGIDETMKGYEKRLRQMEKDIALQRTGHFRQSGHLS